VHGHRPAAHVCKLHIRIVCAHWVLVYIVLQVCSFVGVYMCVHSVCMCASSMHEHVCACVGAGVYTSGESLNFFINDMSIISYGVTLKISGGKNLRNSTHYPWKSSRNCEGSRVSVTFVVKEYTISS
jgi:hypothetical protein